MTTLARVENGEVVTVGLPQTGELADGSIVSNYHNLPYSVLQNEGWVQVESEPPAYNEETEDLVFEGYEYDPVTNKVKGKYRTEAKPPPPEPEPDPEIARQKFRTAVSNASTLAALKAAILGDEVSENPGAAPDLRGKP